MSLASRNLMVTLLVIVYVLSEKTCATFSLNGSNRNTLPGPDYTTYRPGGISVTKPSTNSESSNNSKEDVASARDKTSVDDAAPVYHGQKYGATTPSDNQARGTTYAAGDSYAGTYGNDAAPGGYYPFQSLFQNAAALPAAGAASQNAVASSASSPDKPSDVEFRFSLFVSAFGGTILGHGIFIPNTTPVIDQKPSSGEDISVDDHARFNNATDASAVTSVINNGVTPAPTAASEETPMIPFVLNFLA